MERLGAAEFTAGMTDFSLARVLTIVACIGAGVVVGVFFAFSSFVMQALRELPDAQGLAAMQAINKAAPTPVFMAALFGSAVVCLGLAVPALMRLDERSARLQLAGSALYLAGVVLTIVYHVPRNDALASLDPASAGAAGAWRDYAGGWTLWNHVRMLTSVGAAISFILSL
jgi:uncharacterized membrane protein